MFSIPKQRTKTISELLVPRASLPSRINVKGLCVDAIGKPVRLDEAKGKDKGVRGAGKGSNGKGKPTMVKSSLRASIFVLEPDTGYMMWYQIAIGNLLNSRELVYLELDEFSSTVPLSINCDGNDIVEFDTTHMELCVQNEVALLLVGSYLNIVLY